MEQDIEECLGVGWGFEPEGLRVVIKSCSYSAEGGGCGSCDKMANSKRTRWWRRRIQGRMVRASSAAGSVSADFLASLSLASLGILPGKLVSFSWRSECVDLL